MLDIQQVNHVGIRVAEKAVSISFYQTLGFALISDVGFEKGHPVIMKHASGVEITGSFSFGKMSAVFSRDPDRNVIELDAYGKVGEDDMDDYSAHP